MTKIFIVAALLAAALSSDYSKSFGSALMEEARRNNAYADTIEKYH